MACFLIPAAEAVVTTIVRKAQIRKESAADSKESAAAGETGIKFSDKLGWLNNMLWGGSALLAFEHVWHGEVVPWFPFLTNAASPDSAAEMLHEMATAGVSMAVLVTLVWAGMVGISSLIAKRPANDDNSVKAGEKS